MSATRRFTLVFTLALAIIVMSAAAALAQGGSPNPSGGTHGCRQVLVEGAGSIGLVDYLSKGLALDLGLRGWFDGHAMSRYVVPAANRRVSGRTLTAVAPRRIWER